MQDDETPGGKLLAEVVRLWLPIIVSLCAIGLTVFQAMTTRRHARLSVQPRLEWRIEQDTRSETFEVSVVNVGLGPAILRAVAITVDGDPKRLADLAACDAVSAALGRAPQDFDATCFVQSTRARRAGRRRTGALPERARARAPGHGRRRPADRLYRRFAVTGRYCSFYEECWPIETP
ncbi:MAG: hypothetical protein QM699_09325 [Amaricoccus sp.]|uniref:hypothetical protein n=1 Tax=Amaricoccus sp. TaxID=1872485 RepID=UPI0039E717BA